MTTLSKANNTSANTLLFLGVQPKLFIYLYIGFCSLMCALIYSDALYAMRHFWQNEEYSHGYMIPLISLYLLLRALPEVKGCHQSRGWLGAPLLLLAFLMFVVGEVATLYTVQQYSFLVAIVAIVTSVVGVDGVGRLKGGLFYLIFMIPLPNFLYFNLSSYLQLISSSFGVGMLRLLDVSVFLEGNIIDLGSYQLQVVEACSGLRYLFPLMSFGFLVVCIYRSPLWQKAFLFLSTIPITIFMNSLRIAVIGVTVDNWGIAAAEGFIHDFEGWVVFMACLGILALEIILLHKLSTNNISRSNSGSPLDKLDLSMPDWSGIKEVFASLRVGWVALVVSVLLVLCLFIKYALTDRAEYPPERASFSEFPLQINSWTGREASIDSDVLESLKLTDYFMANYLSGVGTLNVNLYIAYYGSQRKGASIHSPKGCLPGGGWRIESIKKVEVQDIYPSQEKRFHVNRVVMNKGAKTHLVYYWFQQRGRNITNEYLAKWYLLWDSIAMNRTDGALVRVVAPVGENEKIVDLDNDLSDFLRELIPQLSEFVPD